VVDVWGERGPLGIIHPEVVARESWFQPMKVGGYLEGKKPRLACADVHMSHEMMIGLDGTFYCNRSELSSSYFLWTEQTAVLWDFSMTRPWRRLLFAADNREVAAVLAPRLARYRIDDLSDQYGQVYGTDRFAVGIGDRGRQCDVLVAEGELPAEFADLKLDRPPKPKSRVEPAAASDGRRRPSRGKKVEGAASAGAPAVREKRRDTGKWRRLFESDLPPVEQRKDNRQYEFGPPATKADLRYAELALGFRLPADVRSLLSEFNGVWYTSKSVRRRGYQRQILYLDVESMAVRVPEFLDTCDDELPPAGDLRKVVFVCQANGYDTLWGVCAADVAGHRAGAVVRLDLDVGELEASHPSLAEFVRHRPKGGG
jgi:hypothetical protein